MNYPRYVQSLLQRTQWEIREGTYQMLNEKLGLWIARVHTTHNKRGNMPEVTFTVLGRGYEHITINDNEIPDLKRWFLAQEG